tara:strand:- start:677 stop:892 length:216 start_codon:yes stop_codon:yes gene_type:complete
MYTKEDYLSEKNAMGKQERMIQERFEQLINVLIMFKQEHRDKDVFLSEKSINEALKWFQGNVSSLMESMQK